MAKKLLLVFVASFLLLQLIEAAMMGTMTGPKCQEFCPTFCDGKCSGTKAKATCNGETCHCGCSVMTVSKFLKIKI